MRLSKHLLATTILCSSLCGVAHAVDAPSTVAVEELVVTAQKRSESLSSVGMAITAMSGDQMKIAGVTGVEGLTKLDPSFIITNSNYGAPVYSIRGVFFNNASLAAAPTVSIYTDEVPYAYPLLTKGATFDLERVEILKGPQGTLYGQNSTAGAINYIAAKPTKEFSAGVEASYGSFNAVTLDGYVSGTVAENLRMRLAIDTEQGGAWQKSVSRDDTLGNKDVQRARLITDWDPTDRLSVSVNLNAWQDRSDNLAGQFYALAPATPAFVSQRPGLTSAVRPPNESNRWADWTPGTHPRLNEKYIQGSVRVGYKITDDIDFTYLGSYESFDRNDIFINSGTTTPNNILFNGRVLSYVQEARLSGTLSDGKLKWLAGLSYQDTLTNERQVLDLRGGTAPFSYVALVGAPYTGFTNVSRDISEATAGFANVDYDLGTTLTFHGGARYTKTDINHGGCTKSSDPVYTAGTNESNRRIVAAIPGAPPYVGAAVGQCTTLGPALVPTYITDSLKEDNVSWRVGMDWKPAAGTIVYGTISQGYKAGSFNTQSASVAGNLAPVTQESLLAYELGTRTRFLENRVSLDASIFYYDYKDKQVEGRAVTLFGIASPLVNLPKSRVMGAEVDVTLAPITDLVIHLKQTYLDSEILGNTPGFTGFGQAVNFEGEPFAQSPKYSVVLDAQYKWDLTSDLQAFVGANASYRTSATSQIATYGFTSAAYTVDSTKVKPYGLLGLRAGVLTADGRWRFQVSGDNVTDTYYWTQMLRQSDTVVRYMGRPRSFMATIAYKY
jgi:iron complex outermembrane receptor protein